MKIQNGISLVPPTPEAKAEKTDQALRDASEMYEGYFLNQMVRAMRATVPKEDGMIKPNFAEKIFSDQLDSQYVENWSKKGGVGLADMIYSQISERYQASTGKKNFLPHGSMPIAPRREMHGVPSTDSIRMKAIPQDSGKGAQYRFEIPNPSGAEFEAQAPLSGKVVEQKTLPEGWNLVRLDHGQGVTSELTFPGHSPAIGTGTHVQTGQGLGKIDLARPVLAWKLDWT
jgi:Rod binding domain-containing protein